MKKIALTLLIIAGSYSLSIAQGSAVPAPMLQMFKSHHGNIPHVIWQPINKDWWKVSFVVNGDSFTYTYNFSGQWLYSAIPVTETSLPQEILNNIVARFGSVIYDVTKITGVRGRDVYVVRLFELNGQLRTEFIEATQLTSDNDPHHDGN